MLCVGRVFTSVDQSYAARTGRPDNVGVIGVAVFREAAPVLPPGILNRMDPSLQNLPRDAERSAAGSAAPAAPSALAKAAPGAMDQALGTGHGPIERSTVSSTEFRRQHPQPDFTVSIRYDRTERLVAMGVIAAAPVPRAFPNAAQQSFVPDPPLYLR